MSDSMNKKLPFNFGVTLYSFNREYYTYEKTLEDIIADVATLGKGTGVEIVLPMMERHYPDLSPEFEHRFKNAMEKYELVPTCMGAYDDAVYQDNDEGAVDYIVRLIKTAHQLGYKAARVLPPARLRLYEQIVKYGEKYDVQCLTEIHCPNTLESPNIQEMLKLMDRIDSPYIGIFPDCGTMCKEPSHIHRERFLDLGVREDTINTAYEMWKDKKPADEIKKTAIAMDPSSYTSLMASEIYEYFGHGDPAMIKECRRHIKHIHMKYFNVDDNGEENAVRVSEIIGALKEIDYKGTMSAEYEGHHWFAPYSAIEQIRRMRDLVNRNYFTEC